MTLLPLVVLLTGCTPNDAEVTADYAVFLAAASSENITRLERTGTDVEADPGALGLTAIDCRDLSYLAEAEAIEAARLEGIDYAAECCTGGSGEDCESPIQPRWFSWLDDYAYYVKSGKVEPWRTEAVITTEGDFQLTVHMDIPEFGDFRFGWVIDPDFQPKICADGESGAELVDDQGNWLETWSAGEDGTVWLLNSGSFQTNPSNQDVDWYFDQDWAAGYTFARFADEEFYGHATDYSDEFYRPFYVDAYANDGSCSDMDTSSPPKPVDNDGDGLANGDDPDCEFGMEGTSIPLPEGLSAEEAYNGWVTDVGDFFTNEVTELTTIGKTEFPLQMKIEDNTGRPADGTTAGLDGWLGVSPSWVRIDNPDAIAVKSDTPVTGEFQVYLEGVAAASKVLVRGTFSIDNIREDVWGYQGKNGMHTLEEIKRAENDTPECGEERLTSELGETEG